MYNLIYSNNTMHGNAQLLVTKNKNLVLTLNFRNGVWSAKRIMSEYIVRDLYTFLKAMDFNVLLLESVNKYHTLIVG